MPLPLILGVIAAAAGAVGVGSGIHGGMKMKDANDTMKLAESNHKNNIAKFENQSKKTSEVMDKIGVKELEILDGFKEFINIYEKIQNKPEIRNLIQGKIKLPEYDSQELKNVSIGAGVLLGGIGGAALGTAGGFAAAGATTAAVMALGTASTGTAIASLTGAAATNAALAALGGGALAAGGGGMALGSAILGGATLGVSLLVGGIIFNITGSSLSNKADEAMAQMKEAEEEINKICVYLIELEKYSKKFYHSLVSINRIYVERFKKLVNIVEVNNKVDWDEFTDNEKNITKNVVMLNSLLHKMCTIKLVLVSENESNKVNSIQINEVITDAKTALEEPLELLEDTEDILEQMGDL